MQDNRNGEGETKPKSIEEMLRERERLSQIIQEEFKKEVTILFTDITGYTAYTDAKGDISSRTMVQKHNDIVFPLVEKYQGTVIKTIGDEVMASFGKPADAVQAAIDIQNDLKAHNQKAEKTNRIHVTIGINTGDALVDDSDVFGDVVNVAARIQSEAQKDEILISGNLYEEICGSDELLCRFHDTVEVKGKSEPLQLYRVVWKDEDVQLSSEPMVRSSDEKLIRKHKAPQNILHLEVARVQDTLKLSAFEQIAGEASTVKHYEEIPVPMDKIGVRCKEIVDTLNKANRKGFITRDVLMKLREIGQVFSDDLFTPAIKEKIRGTKAENLIVSLDDQLVQIPWELLSDGKQFLCQRFSMGRLVRTRQNVAGTSRTRALARPLRMLILADPRGDLKGAYQEGTQLRDTIDQEKDFVNASLRSGSISPDFIREKIRNFDFVHYAGHSDYNESNPAESGWRLTKGNFKARDIMKMTGTSVMPALIFSNACQSARTEEWDLGEYFQNEIFGLANAFILAGVKHYIGTFWEILDEPSRRFALEFYKQVLEGSNVGEAVRQARLELIKEYGEETIVWASYLLYGDPTFNYMDQIHAIEPSDEAEEAASSRISLQEKGTRAGEEVIDFSEQKVKGKRSFRGIAVVCTALLAAIVLWGYPGYLRTGTEKYEQAVLSAYSSGNFEDALRASKTLEDKAPKVRLSYLVQGDIYFRNGNLDAAQAAYRKAVDAPKGTDDQKARAFTGLGRIASLQKQTDVALGFYQKATALAPTSGSGYMAQAMVLDGSGRSKEALDLFRRAQELAPDDRLLAAVAGETQSKVSLSQDQEKQDRIDKLVGDLLERMESPPVALPDDGWTSKPLTLWLMDFKIQGYAFREGEDKLLLSGITDQLLQNSRIQLVERALLDTLLKELKLSTSELTDRRTALALGKILAARLMLSGQITYTGPQTQVSMRLIETETGRISAAVSETFGGAVPPSAMVGKLSGSILSKIEKTYPIRGKITNVEGKDIKLNIGHNQGLEVAQQLRTINSDMILEVVSAESDSSYVSIRTGEDAPLAGMRVEALP